MEQMPGAYFRTTDQRKIAKRCGHGCVICGQLITGYYYTRENAGTRYARVEAAATVLLCTQHWRQLRAGILTQKQLEAAINAPYNLQKSKAVIKPLTAATNSLSVTLGHIMFYVNYDFTHTIESIIHSVNNTSYTYHGGNNLYPLTVDETKLFAINILDKRISFSLMLYNDYNELLLNLNRNIVNYVADNIDCRISGETLTVTQADTELLQLQYNKEEAGLTVNHAHFQLNGVQCVVSDGILLVNGAQLSVTTEELCKPTPFGIVIGAKQEFTPCVTHLEKISRVHTATI